MSLTFQLLTEREARHVSSTVDYLTAEDVLTKRREFLIPAVGHYYHTPPLFVKGSKQFLWDSTGKQYLDMFSGIVTVASGHCHPKINEAVKEQIERLQHTSALYLSGQMELLAEKLAEIAPGELRQSFICNSGTEANEGAVLTAKLHTNRHEFIALRHSFHGRSNMTISMTGQSDWRNGGPYVTGVQFAASPYCYRCPFGKSYPNCELECAKDVENVIRTATSGAPAAMIAEPIQGNGGIITPPKEYFPEVKKTLEKYGVLFISDEVQTGFGRTGNKWFGIEQWDVTPDIMTMAKGLGNGWPIGAFITTSQIAKNYSPGSHICTFGGNPISSVAALTNINTIQEEKLAQNAFIVGNYFKEKLLALQEKHRIVGDVRGMGLMLGVELVRDKENKAPAPREIAQIIETCKDKGVLIGKGGLDKNVIRIAPPLCITKSDIDTAIDVLEEALTTAEKLTSSNTWLPSR